MCAPQARTASQSGAEARQGTLSRLHGDTCVHVCTHTSHTQAQKVMDRGVGHSSKLANLPTRRKDGAWGGKQAPQVPSKLPLLTSRQEAVFALFPYRHLGVLFWFSSLSELHKI